MAWEYLYLKHKLALAQTPVLDVFERYCANSYADMDRFEWSCEFSEGRVVSHRFIHISSIRSPPNNVDPNLIELLDSIKLAERKLPISLAHLNEVIKEYTERINVSYESPVTTSIDKELIKIYLQLKVCPEILLPSLQELGLGTPKGFPPGNPGVMYCLRIPTNGLVTPRFYVAYDMNEYEDQSVRAYVKKLIGNRALRFLQSHRRGMMNSDSPRMLYVSMNGAGQSEMLTLVRELTSNVPLLRQRLDKVTWVGVPETELDADMPKLTNVYVRLNK